MDPIKQDGQPPVDPSSASGQPSVSEIDLWTEVELQINWETTKVTLEELQKWYMRQSDYTKKTTALSEDKKKLLDPKLEEAKKVLEEMWFAKSEDLAELIKMKDQFITDKQLAEENKEFNDFASQFKTLSDSQKSILKDLKKVHSDKSYDDILTSSGFLDQSLIEKAKSSRQISGASLWISHEEEKPSVNQAVKKRMGIKPASEVADIKSKFNL